MIAKLPLLMFILLHYYGDWLRMNIKMPVSALIPSHTYAYVHDGLDMGVDNFFL